MKDYNLSRGFAARSPPLRKRSAEHLHLPNDKPIIIADWNFQTRFEHTVIQLFADAAVAARFAAAYYCALMKLCDEEDAPISRVYRPPHASRRRYYHRARRALLSSNVASRERIINYGRSIARDGILSV